MVKQDDQQAFEAALAPALKVIYKVAYNLTRNEQEAEDLVQDAAVKAFRAFYSFEPGTNFKAWFIRILTNLFYYRYRKQQRHEADLPLEEISELYLYNQARKAHIPSRNSDPAIAVLAKIDIATIDMALQKIPEEYRIVATMYFMDDFSYQEIADMLNLPIGTVRSRLHRARKLLQKLLWELAEEQGIVASLRAARGV